MTGQPSLSTLPPEIIEMIAKNLSISDLVSFQDSSSVMRAAISHDSFHFEFLTRNYANKAIKTLLENRDEIDNWKELLERFYKNDGEFSNFFYNHEVYTNSYTGHYFSRMTDFQKERLGFKLGKLFEGIRKSCLSSRNTNMIAKAQEQISTARINNPELAKTNQWQLFEDLLFADVWSKINGEVYKKSNLNNLEHRLSTLDFACKNNYANFGHKIAKYIIFTVIRKVANGSLDCDQGVQYALHLIPQMNDMADIQYVGYLISETTPNNVSAVGVVYNVLLREIIGKKKNNYHVFFQNFMQEFILSLAQNLHEKENVQDYLGAAKDCLKWRFALRETGWRNKCDFDIVKRLFILDEEIREIISQKCLGVNGDFLNDMKNLLQKGCSISFRKACEKILYSSEYVSEDNKLVIAARYACRKRAEVQSKESS